MPIVGSHTCGLTCGKSAFRIFTACNACANPYLFVSNAIHTCFTSSLLPYIYFFTYPQYCFSRYLRHFQRLLYIFTPISPLYPPLFFLSCSRILPNRLSFFSFARAYFLTAFFFFSFARAYFFNCHHFLRHTHR